MCRRSHLLVGVAVFLGACSVSSDRVATVKSPSGHLQAVLDETNGGATTDFGYIVSVAPTKQPDDAMQVANLYGAFRNENAYGVNLVWAGDHTLEIQFLGAKHTGLEQPSPVSVGGVLVKVHLRSGVRDNKARAGGMAYNLEHHRR